MAGAQQEYLGEVEYYHEDWQDWYNKVGSEITNPAESMPRYKRSTQYKPRY